MSTRVAAVTRILRANTRALASTIAVLMMMSALVAVRHDGTPMRVGGNKVAIDDPTQQASPGEATPDATGSPILGPDGTPIATTGPGGVPTTRGGVKGPVVSLHPMKGVDYKNRKIKVVFYWNDSSQASPYLKGSGQEGNLDDGLAFEAFVRYVNKHRNGGATLMGFPFNLHGFQIEGHVIHNVGKSKDNFDFWVGEITQRIKPFAAMSARSSPSAYICPELAKAGIYNFGTYDFYMRPAIAERMNGYCYSFGLSFERQVDITAKYLQWHQRQPNNNPTMPGKRVYGFLYAAYKGLIESAPKAVERLRAAGINIPKEAVAKVATDLGTSQTQMPAVVDKFRDLGVNMVIMPDAGAPLNFTHAATANRYYPDYYVWPGSGQDSTGFVRLLNPAQWSRASGLTVYDDTFDADLTNDNVSRSTEWYRQFKEVSNEEPPAPTPLVYDQMLPLLVGLTAAGPTMDLEKFREGIRNFRPYRYSGIEGRTSKPDNIKIDFLGDGSIWADVAKVYWDPAAPRPGGSAGAYVYPERKRYSSSDSFS